MPKLIHRIDLAHLAVTASSRARTLATQPIRVAADDAPHLASGWVSTVAWRATGAADPNAAMTRPHILAEITAGCVRVTPVVRERGVTRRLGPPLVVEFGRRDAMGGERFAWRVHDAMVAAASVLPHPAVTTREP